MTLPVFQCRQAVENPNTRALVLTVIAEDVVDPGLLYGPDAIDALVLFNAIEEACNGRLHEANRNRLQAMLLMRSTDAFESDPLAFSAVALAFVDGQLGDLITGGFEDLLLDEALWALFEGACVDPYMGEPSRAVLSYVKQTAMEAVVDDSDDSDGEIQEEIQELVSQLSKLSMDSNSIQNILKRGTEVLNAVQEHIAEEIAAGAASGQ